MRRAAKGRRLLLRTYGIKFGVDGAFAKCVCARYMVMISGERRRALRTLLVEFGQMNHGVAAMDQWVDRLTYD